MKRPAPFWNGMLVGACLAVSVLEIAPFVTALVLGPGVHSWGLGPYSYSLRYEKVPDRQ